MEKIKQNAFVKKVGFNRIILVLVMLVMYLSFGLLTGGKFFGMSRIMDTMNYVYFLGFLSLGVTFVIATGGIDFSIGPVMFCCALVSGYSFLTHGIPMAAALILSVVIGWYRNFVKAGNVPTGLIIFLTAAIICGVVLNKTKAGRYILCLGSNKEAVRLSGVDVKKWEMLAYVICGILVGIAAIFYVGAYTTVQPGYGDQYNNEAIAGCVMGGTSMAGGLASIGGTVIGVLIISLLQQGILALGFSKDYQFIITGIIVIAAVYADVSARRRKN